MNTAVDTRPKRRRRARRRRVCARGAMRRPCGHGGTDPHRHGPAGGRPNCWPRSSSTPSTTWPNQTTFLSTRRWTGGRPRSCSGTSPTRNGTVDMRTGFPVSVYDRLFGSRTPGAALDETRAAAASRAERRRVAAGIRRDQDARSAGIGPVATRMRIEAERLEEQAGAAPRSGHRRPRRWRAWTPPELARRRDALVASSS